MLYQIRILTLLFVFFIAFSAHASLRDSETLMISSDRHPSVLQTITGEFVYHSRDYYLWKIADRLGKIKEHPDSLIFYDDLKLYRKQYNLLTQFTDHL